MSDARRVPGPAAQLRRRDAQEIWQAGVDAVQPHRCLNAALNKLDAIFPPYSGFDRILVVGAGKAGAEMSRVLESALEQRDGHPASLHPLAPLPPGRH
jgi:glycerate-2-kinase